MKEFFLARLQTSQKMHSLGGKISECLGHFKNIYEIKVL